jgi:hypothetical protein
MRGLPGVVQTFAALACLQDELSFNPFLRIAQPEVIAYCGGASDPVEVLATLRKKKDGF